MKILQISPLHLSDVATLSSEIQKSHFSTLLFIYFILFTIAQKKTSSNCCSAALAVYLLLFSASYYLHSPSTASGARYRRSACIDMNVLRLAAAACCDVDWISAQRVVLYATDQSRKRLEACINAERGHPEHLLWHCLPNIPVVTSQPVLFRATDDNPQMALFRASNVRKNATNVQSGEKVLHSQVSVMKFSGVVGKWLTDCFLVR